MSGKRVQLFSVAGMLLLVLSVAALARFNQPSRQTTKQAQEATDPALKEIANYRQWKRVNEEPVPVFIEGTRARG